jgi:hypothetical protein
MNSQLLAESRFHPGRDWQFAVAIGFLALTCLGAAMDRRGAILDRTVTASPSADRVVVPLTNAEHLHEMLTHD